MILRIGFHNKYKNLDLLKKAEMKNKKNSRPKTERLLLTSGKYTTKTNSSRLFWSQTLRCS